jgi:hypothetical protein
MPDHAADIPEASTCSPAMARSRVLKNSTNMPVWIGVNTINGGEVISSDSL